MTFRLGLCLLLLPAFAVAQMRDFGDLPDTYQTTLAANGAWHTNLPGVFLGTGIDTETNGIPSPQANTDFDDGVLFLSPLIPGGYASLGIIAATGGYASAWIDFNGDGDWSGDPGEKIVANRWVREGSNYFPYLVPVNAVTNVGLGARIRFTHYDPSLPGNCPAGNCSGGGIFSSGPAWSGEVEDYMVTANVVAVTYDFGDAPNTYKTTLSGNGPKHIFMPGIHLGSGVDDEADATVGPNADGDDLTGIDDEDGIDFLTALTPGLTCKLRVHAATRGFISGYIDFNADGNFTADPLEKILKNVYLDMRTRDFTFGVPTNAVITNTIARFRFTSYNQGGSGLGSSGDAANGEVEDHLVAITGLDQVDFGDAPNANYQTLFADEGAGHVISPGVHLGATVDAEPDGQPSPLANGDDLNGADEDGVEFLTPLIPGETALIGITASTQGYLNAWIDWDADGDWSADDDPANKIFKYRPLQPGRTVFLIDVPTNAVIDTPLVSRFRFSTIRSSDPDGLNSFRVVADGEVEDYVVFAGSNFDFGDAPDGPYATLEANNGPRHSFIPGVYLGSGVTTEPDGQPNATASGDADDGVAVGSMMAGAPNLITVEASTSGFLYAWMDFDEDGSWEPLLSGQPLSPGANPLNFTLPCSIATGGFVNARFRFTPTAVSLNPIGFATGGEVEDYQFGPVTPATDSDADDLPDWWELAHFGNATSAAATNDPDGDGFPNFGEYAADTDPTNGRSFLHLSYLSNSVVFFTSSPNRSYVFESVTTLYTNAWQPLSPPMLGDGDVFWVMNPTNDAARYYRVRVLGCP